jgi:hypothetical protein
MPSMPWRPARQEIMVDREAINADTANGESDKAG